MMKVQIISKATIKPSSPTPPHLKTFNFCFLDQLSPPLYVPIFLFFDNNHDNDVDSFERCSHRLKVSLSETLTGFYPLAGRINGNTSIECNDEGVNYVEARVNGQLSDVISSPNVVDLLKLFLPSDEPHFDVDGSKAGSKLLLEIQVNVFECGGMVISVSLSHKISDSYSMATFINGWAAKTCNVDKVVTPVSELSSLFPQRSLLGHIPSAFTHKGKERIVTKRFVFDSLKTTSLREKVSNNLNPTRVEVVSALLWRRLMVLAQAKNPLMKEYIAIHSVDLRRRMNQGALQVEGLENTLGNFFSLTFTASEPVESKKELNVLVGKMRDSINKVDAEYVRIMRDGDNYLRSFLDGLKSASTGELGLVAFSSWCRFPWYETDFGWGKPIWVCTSGLPCQNFVILMDTRSGDGIEAWVNMLEEDMAEFEQDQELRSFVSLP